MSRGIDLIMEMDTNKDWIRTSQNQARRKTDYEKHLEEEIRKLKDQILIIQKSSWFQIIFKRKIK